MRDLNDVLRPLEARIFISKRKYKYVADFIEHYLQMRFYPKKILMPMLNSLYQTFEEDLINLKQKEFVRISTEIDLFLLFDKINILN